ncbi:AMP-binding protein [Pseudorhodoferax sp.]|uniref:AMP-binding protein n=1 Tax=Pseudorhodoferax sp. TaxID=1993553 RepID=UPI002DD660C1|nr:AMP-binding protein [Pseudorhodoferax sp.]
MTTTVHDLVEAAARQPRTVYAQASETGRAWTSDELLPVCAAVQARLRAHGLRPGDTVSLVLPNGLATLQWLLGAMHGGFIVNPVNLLSQPEQMRYVLEHSDCKLVLAAPDWAERVRALLPPQATVVVVDPDQPLPTPGEGDGHAGTGTRPAPAAEATALLMYTSGTTGKPKGVMLGQAALAANARAIGAEHALGPADRVLGVLPLYHINAFVVTMLAPLASGGSVLLAPRFSAGRFWAQALEGGCTWINVVPTILSVLLQQAEAPPREALARLRFCRSASAALPVEHLRAFEQRFGLGVIETMGLTETCAPCFSNPLQAAQRKPGAVGRASGCEARVVNAELQPLPAGQTGEVTVRGPQLMSGYYKNPEATAATFTPDGWLRTGDLGHVDADGFFFITGRIKELIIKGGENIAPREIDEVLLRHPAVLDAAAVGEPDAHYGQEILAAVVLREGMQLDENELRSFCEQHLGRYKTPRRVRFVAELPRGPSGKVQRLKLLES